MTLSATRSTRGAGSLRRRALVRWRRAGSAWGSGSSSGTAAAAARRRDRAGVAFRMGWGAASRLGSGMASGNASTRTGRTSASRTSTGLPSSSGPSVVGRRLDLDRPRPPRRRGRRPDGLASPTSGVAASCSEGDTSTSAASAARAFAERAFAERGSLPWASPPSAARDPDFGRRRRRRVGVRACPSAGSGPASPVAGEADVGRTWIDAPAAAA